MIDTIFIFAAGLGTRMSELTKNLPKPLLQIGTKTLLEHNLEFVLSYSFKRIIINTHYKADKILKFISAFKMRKKNLPEVVILHEEERLETGGAIKNAVKILKLQNSIFTLNCDVIIRAEENLFESMITNWNQNQMDFLLLLQDYNKAVGYKGLGDFDLSTDNKLIRKNNIENYVYRYMYSGLSIIKPELIAQNPNIKFSLSEYYKNSQKAYGFLVKDSLWYHASSPKDLEEITNAII